MSFKYIFSRVYEKTIKSDYFNSYFKIKSKWNKLTRLSCDNESVDVFYVTNESKIYIAKFYKDLTNYKLNLIKRLENSIYTEEYLDDDMIYFDSEQRFSSHVVLYDRIEFSSLCIPKFIQDETVSMRLLFDCLDYIHNKKILHNDIKPDNIMFDGKHIKLIDFEFAVDFETKKFNNLNVLSMYKHPKMWRNQNYFSKKKDFWAAICSIFYIYNNYDIFFELSSVFEENEFNEFENYMVVKKFIFENNDIKNIIKIYY